jgi:hypothetical protein
MNEIITHFMSEAQIIDSQVSNVMHIRRENLQKFTESIVSECIWRLMVLKEEAIVNNWRADEAMSIAITDISEHFGVEE